ncbi:uncharacterized protein ACBT44_002619 isoform 1-T2 [Syngnathus typhle]
MAVVLLLLACVGGAVWGSAQAQDAYNLLPADYKKGVDLALMHLNSHAGVHHHFRFLRSLEKSDAECGFDVKYYYHRFQLKPTRCAKGSTSSTQICPFRNDRPLMDCAVCYKTEVDQILLDPTPYVHCIQRPRLTQEMVTTRTEHCKQMNYNTGGLTLLAVQMD